MAEKVTRMELKVDLSSPGCYEKVKKSLCEFTEIRAQMYDKKTNLVKITVVCGSHERFRDKLFGIDTKVIQSIEILEPPQPRVAKPTKPADPPKTSRNVTAPAPKLRATEPNQLVAPDPTPTKSSTPATAPAAKVAATKPNTPVAPDQTPRVAKTTKPGNPPKIPSPATAPAAKLAATKPNPQVAPNPTPRLAKPTKPSNPPKIPSLATVPAAKVAVTKPNPPVAPDPTPRVAKPTKIPSRATATAPAAKPRKIPADTTHHQGSYYYLSDSVLTDEKEKFEDAIWGQDEQTGNPGQTLEVSLHTLSCATQRQTITLEGKIKDKLVTILIDTGSTFSFISSEMAKVLDLMMEEIEPLSVIVADGREITSSEICKGVEWELQQYRFIYDLRVMDIGEDIILGVDWMYLFSPISFDYKQSKISLSDDNGTIVLTAFKDKQINSITEAGTQTSIAGNTTLNDSLNGLIESSTADSASDEANDPKGNLVCQSCRVKFKAYNTMRTKEEFLLSDSYCNRCQKWILGA